MQESTLAGLEQLFLALSDKTRLRLLALMADGEVPVGYLADQLGESQPKISRHLAYLRGAAMVSTRREGKWIYYAIEKEMDTAVARVLQATLRAILADGVYREAPLDIDYGGDAYRPPEPQEISDETYTSDWAPQELEIYLL